MIRRRLLLLLCFYLVPCVVSGEVDDADAPFAQTTEEKAALLEKAEQALLWYRSLHRETRLGIPPAGFRQKILPLELMQAADLLKKMDKADVSRMLREMLPYYQVTPEECFEIEERLGETSLESFLEEKEILSGDAVDSVTRIREGSAKFLADGLRPAERMALIDDPKTARELIKAIDLLAMTGRPVLARFYVRRFLDVETTPEECARIAESVGTRKLMQLAADPKLTPNAELAVARVFREANKHWRSDETVAEALDQWKGTGEDGKLDAESSEALRALWRGERVSIGQMIDKLAEMNTPEEADPLLAVLLSMGEDGKRALVESLRSDNTKLLEYAVRGLETTLGADEVFLLYPVLFSTSDRVPEALRKRVGDFVARKTGRAVDRREAVATLYGRARDYTERNRPLKSGPDGYVRFWNWSDEERKPKYIRMLVPSAYRLFAFRYAEQAMALLRDGVQDNAPQRDRVRQLYLTTLLDRAAYLNDRNEPLSKDTAVGLPADVLAGLKPVELERILDESIRREHYGAAQVAASLLAGAGDAKTLLTSTDGKPRSLVRAVTAPDRRVRFAALTSIMSLQPDTPFPGSSLVSDALVWFSRADGRRLLVSGNPKQAIAARTAGYFIACGYRGEPAVTSKEAMRLAADSPDVEMMVIDLRCSQPSVPNLVQAMRSDCRTHEIPIAVLTGDAKVLDEGPNLQSLPEMQRIDRLDPSNPFGVSLSQIYPGVVSEKWARHVESDLMKKTGADPVPPDVRIRQARQALGWLKAIALAADEGPKIYHFEDLEDTVLRAMRSDMRIRQGLELASAVRSAALQAAIYEVVADAVYPMELREKAAEHLTESVGRFGILLRGKQVQRLYDRYNAGEHEPKETQDLLGRMIDLIEDKVFEKRAGDADGPASPAAP